MNESVIGHETENEINYKTRILLADDHPLLREALRNVLEREPDFKVIGEAGDGEETVHLAQTLSPDVVIMDISMPKISGLEATRIIKESCPNIAVLVLTVHDDNEHIFSILEAGAAGYLTKSVFGKEVVNAIRGVASGETVLSSSVLSQLVKHAVRFTSKPVRLNISEKITGRELEILKMAACGMSNKDIAHRLDLSLRTVKGHLQEIFSKLNVASRTEAVITALRNEIINLEDIK